MLDAILTACLCLPLGAQDPAQKPPSAEEVKAALTKLEHAFSKGKAPDRVRAIGETAEVVDARVIAWTGKGLTDEDASVRMAAIETLGRMRHVDALDVLQAAWKRDKTLRKDDELSGRVLKAIARHGSPKSIALLADDPFETMNHGALQARILGLGNIRSKESVEALIGMMRLAGPNRMDAYMGDFRLALLVLTGTDQGRASQMWFNWWNDHQKDFEVPGEMPQLSRIDRARWTAYWEGEPGRENQRAGRKLDRDAKKGE